MPRNRTTRARNRERYRALKRANGANDGTPKRGPSPYHERPAKTHPSRGGVFVKNTEHPYSDRGPSLAEARLCRSPRGDWTYRARTRDHPSPRVSRGGYN